MVVTERSASVMIQMRVPSRSSKAENTRIPLAQGAQVLQLVVSSNRPRVQVHMADDVVDWVLAGGREGVLFSVGFEHLSEKFGI